MKIIVPVVFVVVTVFCSCNTNQQTKIEKTLPDDTVKNSLVNLTAVNTLPQLLCQNWEDKEDIDDGVLNSSSSDLEIPFHGYSFFEDGSMVQNPRDNMKAGKWLMDEKTKHISIVLEDGTKKDCQLNALGVKNLILKNGKEKALKYVADGKKHSNLSDDPFYPANNTWRIKPGKQETDKEIKKRVINCVLFYNKFFQDNADRNAATISLYGLPTCFKWYSGGISIIKKEKLGQKWMGCFYNKDQAIQGQQLLENSISKKYNWNRSETKWVRQSADVLRQMADSLK